MFAASPLIEGVTAQDLPIRNTGTQRFLVLSPALRRELTRRDRGSFGGFQTKPLLSAQEIEELNAKEKATTVSIENSLRNTINVDSENGGNLPSKSELTRSASCVSVKSQIEQTPTDKNLKLRKRSRVLKKRVAKSLHKQDFESTSTEILEPMSPMSPIRFETPLSPPKLNTGRLADASETAETEEQPSTPRKRRVRARKAARTMRSSSTKKRASLPESMVSDSQSVSASSDLTSEISTSEQTETALETGARLRRYRLMKELVATEKSYLDAMTLAKEIWGSGLKHMMTRELHKTIFGNLSPIICLSQILLPRFTERLAEFDEKPYVGDIFKEFIPAFKVYTDHLQHHTNFTKDLSDFRREKQQEYTDFAKKAQKITKSYESLDSYLIQPVQRLPRYRLLLGNMLDVTPASVDVNLREAYDHLTRITKNINETMNECANRIALFDLAQRFRLESRDILLEQLMNRCPELVKQELVRTHDVDLPYAGMFLLSDCLIIGEPVTKKSPPRWETTQFRVKWSFPLETLFVRDYLDQPGLDQKQFHLVNPTHSMTFETESVKDARIWKQAIEASIGMVLSMPTEEEEKPAFDDEAYLVLNSQGTFVDANVEHRLHVRALRERRKNINVWLEDGEWKAIERLAPPTSACERVTLEEYEAETQDATARALAELQANPAFEQWQAQQAGRLQSLPRPGSATPKKTVLSRLGGAMSTLSPTKWRATRIRTGQTPGKFSTPDRNAPATPPIPTSRDARVFTSPRARVARLTSPIEGLDQDIVQQLIQRPGGSPNSKRRLAFDDDRLF